MKFEPWNLKFGALALVWAGTTLIAHAQEDPIQRGLARGSCFAYYPSRNELRVKIDLSRKNVRHPDVVELGKSFKSVTIIVVKKQTDNPLLKEVIPIADGQSEARIYTTPALEGEYNIRFAFNANGKEPVVVTREFERRKFPWEGNRLGITDEVYPPFEPVQVQGNEVRVVQRLLKMNGMGLWDEVVTKGRNILAAPITLRYELANGQTGVFEPQGLKPVSVKPAMAVFTGGAASEVAYLKTVSTVEMDGMMKVEMDLLPAPSPKPIRKLWLEIPFKANETPLFFEDSAGSSRENYAGKTPAGEGVVWTSAQTKRFVEWLNRFCAYMWLGAEERGLAWFAENDKGWITNKDGGDEPLQDIFREKDRVIMRVYFVNVPATISESHHLVFGLQASPTKPMPSNWREVRSVEGGLRPHGGPVSPWGGLPICSYKKPYDDDWKIVDKIIESRTTGKVDRPWFENYAATHKIPRNGPNDHWVDRMMWFAGNCVTLGNENSILVYHEEMTACPLHAEWQTFQDEWGIDAWTQRDWPDESSLSPDYEANPCVPTTFPTTYQDYALSFANEWLKRGIGLYWDNDYMRTSFNPYNSAAYVTEDGSVQPARVIWNMREYHKRAWNLLQYWRRHQSRPLEWSVHMTNSPNLPIHTWATMQLDGEDEGNGSPFSPDFLRAESLGLQMGNLPYYLMTVAGQSNPLLKDKNDEEKSRIRWGMEAVHEILPTRDRSNAASFRKLNSLVLSFGYGSGDVRVFNYWDESPVAEVRGGDVKWLVLEKSKTGEVLIVLQSWSPDAAKIDLKLNQKALSVSPATQVTDAETHESCGLLKEGRMSLSMPTLYGLRILRIGTPLEFPGHQAPAKPSP